MSLVDIPDNYSYAWYIRPVLTMLHWRLGKVPEPVKLWARVPFAFIGFQIMLKALERKGSPLEPRLRALVRTRIAQLNNCHFCVDLNASQAMERGVTEEQLQALADFQDSPIFSEAEKAALAFAEAITATGIEIAPELGERLRKSFDDDAVVELAALVAHQNLSAKFNAALSIPAEGFCMASHRSAASD